MRTITTISQARKAYATLQNSDQVADLFGKKFAHLTWSSNLNLTNTKEKALAQGFSSPTTARQWLRQLRENIKNTQMVHIHEQVQSV